MRLHPVSYLYCHRMGLEVEIRLGLTASGRVVSPCSVEAGRIPRLIDVEGEPALIYETVWEDPLRGPHPGTVLVMSPDGFERVFTETITLTVSLATMECRPSIPWHSCRIDNGRVVYSSGGISRALGDLSEVLGAKTGRREARRPERLVLERLARLLGQ